MKSIAGNVSLKYFFEDFKYIEVNTTTHLLTHKRKIYCKYDGTGQLRRPSHLKYLAPQSVSGKDYMSALRLPRKVNYPQLLAKMLTYSYILKFHQLYRLMSKNYKRYSFHLIFYLINFAKSNYQGMKTNEHASPLAMQFTEIARTIVTRNRHNKLLLNIVR